MKDKESGRCFIIPVSIAGQVAAWGVAFGVMTFGTIVGEPAARAWALMLSALAATWTIIATLARQHKAINRAFELGREMGLRSVHH